MRLLLTSAGISNKSIEKALRDMVVKPITDCKIAFIPTAANAEAGDKTWLIDDLNNFNKLKPQTLDIVDISALPKDLWLPRLKAADIIVVGGGNTFHLMHHVQTSGLAKELPGLLKTRVYVGISAGSIIPSPSLEISESKRLYSEEMGEYKFSDGLNYVNFYIRPHLNSPYFTNVREEIIEEKAKDVPGVIYAIDDQSAIQVIDNKINIISEGKFVKYN